MTKNQRDYLADLAGRKGVRLFDNSEWSVARASEEIERLKSLPDAVFDEISEQESKKIDTMTQNVLASLHGWEFA